MKKIFIMTAAALLLAPAAFAADPMQQNNVQVQYKDDGGYTAEKSGEQIDANGVKHTADSKTDVNYDSNGNMKKTISNSDTVKKGLFQKKTNESKTEYQEKNDGGFTQTTTAEHTNDKGTDIKSQSKTESKFDANGNKIVTTKSKETIDPPGLMNKTTTTTVEKTVNGTVVEDQTKN